ncbi:phosphate signaling complex protein PhoU [Gorillibacterium massiliense]|uniref:phosphate signaling complex protein PhoU n=1 Tax=Gorillibacterium massiliense TaxID=1280390 RepID=UPI0004AF5DD6|nr:phosphate signaling complex protein PhoU [Gorillibacterium massiliense]
MDTRLSFHQSLENLQKELLEMGHMVENQIRLSVESMKTLDTGIARKVVEQDDRVDEMLLRIESLCLRLIALQQPMAGDLRIIGMATKIAVDLERIADHAVDIAKVTLRMSGEMLVKPLVDIPAMAELAIDMLRESLLSFTERDVQRAASLAEKDDVVDALYGKILTELTGMMGTDLQVNRQLSHLMMVAHYIERVADHTTNIGEDVIYVVTGKRKDLNV